MKLSTIAPLGLLIGAGIWAARRPETVRQTVSDALEYLEDTTQPPAKRFEREVLPQARKALKDSSRAATPLLNAATEFAEDWLERGSEFAHQAADWGAESAHDLEHSGSRAVRRGRDWLGRELKAREIAQKKEQDMDTRLVRELAMKLDRQEKAIRNIGQATRPRAAGLPLGWMLLSAGAYYLYKNPDVLHKALDAIKGYIPADASKHLEGAADAVKDGVNRVSRGASPMDAAQNAASEAGSELDKAARDAKRQASDVAKDVGDAAKGVVKDVQKAANA
jgi:hypothetical protein